MFEDPYEAIYEVFCGYQKIEKEGDLERQGINFQRLKEMNRLFSAKMSDGGRPVGPRKCNRKSCSK